VPNAAVVSGFGGAGEPSLVDAAAVGAVRVPIVGMELDRGTEVGVRRKRPWPASRARPKRPPTLSRFVTLARGLATVDMIGVLELRRHL